MGISAQVRVVTNAATSHERLAWVAMPVSSGDESAKFPVFGSLDLRGWPVTFHVPAAFTKLESNFQLAVAAHEVAHVILNTWCHRDWPSERTPGHSLRDSEAAVDITAMLLGFRKLYEAADVTLQNSSSLS